MKRYITLFITLCAVSLSASAQVSKQVEVVKPYVPETTTAKKMSIEPNMVDTTTIRPEIDYTIESHSFASKLSTRHFKPATATYWEYQRRYPFFLKLGAGYPFNTIGDLYGSVHRADVGYISGYANHYGFYSKLRYQNGDGQMYKDNRSMQNINRFGVTGGKYFGRYTLAGDLHYGMDIHHRYPFHNEYAEDGTPTLVYKRRKVDFENVKFDVSFGDSFADYSHFNFKVYASADYYHDKSENFLADANYQQMNVKAGGVMAREITERSAMSLDLDYEGYYGLRSLSNYKNTIAAAQLMYRYRSGGMVDFNIGAKLLYDHNPADLVKRDRWHCFPVANISLHIGDKGLAVPYVEVDGELQNNSYYSLVKQNPYVAILGAGNGLLQAEYVLPNTELYNVRFGVSGHTYDRKFAYRFYANMSFMKNAVYWYNINQIFFDTTLAKRNIWSLCGSVDYRPISQLLLTARVKGILYSDFATLGDEQVKGGKPNVEALVRARYTHKKFAVGGSLLLYGPTKWTTIQNDQLFNPASTEPVVVGTFSAPTSLNLSLDADWYVNKTCTVYLEANNLVGDLLPTYNWAFYREVGASFTVGVKIQF